MSMPNFWENLPIPTGCMFGPDLDLLNIESPGLLEKDGPEDNVLADDAGHDGDGGDDVGDKT